MTEAKCWTCARGYARPDPEGCEYIRSGGQLIPEGAGASVTMSERQYKPRRLKLETTKEYKLQRIISCPQFVEAARQKSSVKDVESPASIRNKWRKKEEQEKRAAKQRAQRIEERTLVPRICSFCGGPIPPDKKDNAKFCSEECCKKRRVERGDIIREIRIAKIPKRPCVVCRTVFQPTKKTQVCCQASCTDKNVKRIVALSNAKRRAKQEAIKNPAGRGPS
jgi:hypothetical protein